MDVLPPRLMAIGSDSERKSRPRRSERACAFGLELAGAPGAASEESLNRSRLLDGPDELESGPQDDVGQVRGLCLSRRDVARNRFVSARDVMVRRASPTRVADSSSAEASRKMSSRWNGVTSVRSRRPTGSRVTSSGPTPELERLVHGRRAPLRPPGSYRRARAAAVRSGALPEAEAKITKNYEALGE